MSLEIQLRGAVKQEENHMTLDRYSPEARKKLDDMQDSISALKMEKGMLEKHVESLESQVHELERALGRGEVDLSKTRVLMLKDNPSSQADQVRWEELQSLRAENQALRDSSVSAGGIPTESVHVFETKINELQQELSSKEKRMVRLKEVLNARVQEFREAICSILGFRVDMMPQGTIKFSSIYSPQRHFEFDSKGALLFGGDGEDLRPGLEKYYETSHVPAFMSWVTLHFFESPM